VTRADYDAVRETARQCRRALADRMRDVDFLLTPSAPSEAPRSHESTGDPVFNRAWTLFGVPCVTVPHGQGAHGLPLGIQLVGPFDGDTALLGWAHWTAGALGV
jgi:Asp-tRNA(Asn)/Glu-tRNA(Gln) amidotransferase A subunit family amidase